MRSYIPCKNRILFVSLLLPSLLLFACGTTGSRGGGSSKVLRTRADGTFRVVQFTDLHYGESPVWDALSAYHQGLILQLEQPDLVVMTGDSVSGYAWKGAQGWFASCWKALTLPMVENNISWAFAFGNHDDQADLTRDQIVQLDQQYALSLTQKGPTNINGTTNYFLPVYSHDESNPIPVAILYFLDSSDVNCEGVEGWGCVYPSQIEWYKNTSTAIRKKYNKIIPALAFFHIPVPEFLDMWNNDTCLGRLEDTGVCCFSVNTGLFAAFKEMGDVVSVHCGHDHDNDFFGIYDDIMLAYGRKTGYGGYGPPEGWLRGARVIEISEAPFTLTHWIRQEDNSTVPSTAQPFHYPGTNQSQYCCDTAHSNASVSNCAEYAFQFETHIDFSSSHEKMHSAK